MRVTLSFGILRDNLGCNTASLENSTGKRLVSLLTRKAAERDQIVRRYEVSVSKDLARVEPVDRDSRGLA